MYNEQNSVQMLLAEFQMLSDAFQKEFEQDHQKLNLHITLISAGLGALLLLGETRDITEYTNLLAALLILIVLTLVGISTLQATISSRIVIDEYYRGMNRIRIFFAERDSNIRKFIIFPLDDLPTSMLSVDERLRTAPASHYMMQTLVTLNSTLISLIAIGVAFLCWPRPLQPSLYLYLPQGMIAVITFLVAQRLQKSYYKRKLSDARQTALENAHFDNTSQEG